MKAVNSSVWVSKQDEGILFELILHYVYMKLIGTTNRLDCLHICRYVCLYQCLTFGILYILTHGKKKK